MTLFHFKIRHTVGTLTKLCNVIPILAVGILDRHIAIYNLTPVKSLDVRNALGMRKECRFKRSYYGVNEFSSSDPGLHRGPTTKRCEEISFREKICKTGGISEERCIFRCLLSKGRAHVLEIDDIILTLSEGDGKTGGGPQMLNLIIW